MRLQVGLQTVITINFLLDVSINSIVLYETVFQQKWFSLCMSPHKISAQNKFYSDTKVSTTQTRLFPNVINNIHVFEISPRIPRENKSGYTL